MTRRDLGRIGYEDFRAMALDESLSRYEKIGAVDEYRRGREEAIFADILAKVSLARRRDLSVLDIGAGCSDLPRMLIDTCAAQGHRLALMDSAEMLSQLPEAAGVEKVAARFPDCAQFLATHAGRVDCILVYSVLHYVFAEANVWDFLDRALALLAPGGELLVGDVPNVSKRKRFFTSAAGIAFHKRFMHTDETPLVEYNRVEAGSIDDAVVQGLLMRGRAQGFDAYVLPQSPGLPMANRREDLLFVRP